jgi:hypothetical protein
LKKACTARAAILAKLAADQVHRLNAVRAFVDLGDARVADELLHAPFADVAVAAIDLLGVDRDFEALVGQIAFDDGRQQRDDVHRRFALRLVGRLARKIDLQRAPEDERAGRLVIGLGLHEHAPDVRVDDDRVGLGARGSRAPGSAPCPGAVLRIGDGVLVGDLALRQALQPDAEPRRVHHDEHGGQALLRLADQPAGRPS